MLKKIFKSKEERAKKHDEKVMKALKKMKQKILQLEESKKEPKNINNPKNQEKINKKISKQKEDMIKMAKKLKIKDGKLVMNKENDKPKAQSEPTTQPEPSVEPVEIPADPQPTAVEQELAQQQAQEQARVQALQQRQAELIAQQQATAQQAQAEQIRQQAYAQAMADLQAQQQPAESEYHQLLIELSNEDRISLTLTREELDQINTLLSTAVNENKVIRLADKNVNGSHIVSWGISEEE